METSAQRHEAEAVAAIQRAKNYYADNTARANYLAEAQVYATLAVAAAILQAKEE